MSQVDGEKNVVIIGSGLAGYTVAREFRKLDKTAPLFIITADDGGFYSKPNLSNLYAHKKTPEQLVTASAEKMAQDLNAKIFSHTSVTKIDTQSRKVVFEQEKLAFDQLVLATGAHTRALPKEVDPDHCALSVNSLADFRVYAERLKTAHHIAIIGSGLIGCEFANDLTAANKKVAVIGNAALPMQPMLAEAAAEGLRNALAKIGVEWHLGTNATRLSHTASGYEITLADGSLISTDLILSAIGLIPNTQLARDCGINVNRGIVVDENLESNVEKIFAIGDCAEIYSTVLPFVMPIMHAAKALAKTLTNIKTKVEFPPMPIIVKTPAYPIALLPPPMGESGQWHFDLHDEGVRGEFRNTTKKLRGFCLTGTMAAQRNTLLKEIAG